MRSLTLIFAAPARHAFPLRPAVIRALVGAGNPGVYLLLRDGRPMYVGRSDTCVQTRLATHPYLGVADHFVWQPCRSPLHAFHMESYWYHSLQDAGRAANLIHPARPAGTLEPCPFCHAAENISIINAEPVTAGAADIDAKAEEAA
ncbi:MAG TPA: hypothetical protein VF746_03145 [Longimicrobium sp.]|jgi:hypothetical protein